MGRGVSGLRAEHYAMRTINRSLAASLFNVFASIALVVIASGVMVWFIRTDPNAAATFSPVYFLVLCLIGGFLFSSQGGKWVTVRVAIVVLILVMLPLLILLAATVWVHEVVHEEPGRNAISAFETNSPSR